MVKLLDNGHKILDNYRSIWNSKKVLRKIYTDYYVRMMAYSNAPSILEIGGGSGNLKKLYPNIISTDLLPTSWIDVACDAQSLPFKEHTFDTIIAVDVLHHIQRTPLFFKEASRVLKTGGRIILLDPAITFISWFFYKFLHNEPVKMNDDPFEEKQSQTKWKPFDANQAIPELIFGKHYKKFLESFPELKMIKKEYISLFCYPLSGGFKSWSLIPSSLVDPLLKLEKKLENKIGRYMSFRLLVVIEKKHASNS
jgi:SAM-dependent methyltransferase